MEANRGEGLIVVKEDTKVEGRLGRLLLSALNIARAVASKSVRKLTQNLDNPTWITNFNQSMILKYTKTPRVTTTTQPQLRFPTFTTDQAPSLIKKIRLCTLKTY